MLISWMITLSSCLIWQLTSFILPPNEYGWVYACKRFVKIIFSDEVHLDFGGYVNKQNCRILDTENRHAYIEKPTLSRKFNCLALHATQLTLHSKFCALFLKISAAELMSFGHLGAAIWNRWTIIYATPTNPSQLTL